MDPRARLRQLRAGAGEALDHSAPWIVLGATPDGRADVAVGAARHELQHWLEREAADWPAPVRLGSAPPQAGPGVLVFRSGAAAEPGIAYHCELHADGSALCALRVGDLRTGPSDGGPVWVLGEGAVAWIVLVLLRLTGGFVARAGDLARAVVEVGVRMPEGGSAGGGHDRLAGVPMEVWNHASGTYGTAGGRLAHVEPVGRAVDLAACRTSDLAAMAQPLVTGLLRQFGVAGSRHIDADGVLRRGQFTGHGERIRAWAEAIGAPTAP